MGYIVLFLSLRLLLLFYFKFFCLSFTLSWWPCPLFVTKFGFYCRLPSLLISVLIRCCESNCFSSSSVESQQRGHHFYEHVIIL